MIRRRNFARTLAAAFLLAAAAALLLLPSAPGHAQSTTTTYVSNINQGSDDETSGTGVKGQRFTTGSQSGGYIVTSVDIGYDDAEGDKFSAAIYTVDNDGYPDSEAVPLTAPTGSWSAGDTLTFTVPANTATADKTLAASTTYTVRLAPSSAAVAFDTTTSSDEDSGAFSGWSIQDLLDAETGSGWIHSTSGEIIRIAIKGTTPAPVDFENLQSGHTSPIGMWSPDGSTLWVGQWFSTQVYAYNLADETAIYSENWTLHNPSTTADRNRKPTGIWSNGTHIYVTDADHNRVFQYNLGDKSLTSTTLSLHADNGSRNGLWSDGTTAWVSDAADNKLYAYVLSDFSRDSDKDIGLHSDNAAARGIWSDGTTIWVLDKDDEKLYAYALADSSRAADLDITLDSAGENYNSIWSDGTTMYVVENTSGSATRDPQIHKLPLPAQDETVVWDATLTSADNWALGSNYTYDGYASSALGAITTTQGSLSPDSFTVGTTTHTVELLGVREGTDNRLYLITDTRVSKSDLARYAMEFTVDGSTTTLEVKDATDESNLGFYWAESLHSFDSDDWQAKTITVKLLPLPADDCAADTTTTCSVSLGGSVTGDIEAVGDEDYFSLSVTSGVSYQIDAEGSGTSMGTLDDPRLILLDASDTVLTGNDDGGDGLNARIVWRASSTGTVYVEVSHALDDVTGTYTLTVSEGPADDCADDTTTTCSVSPGSPVTGDIQYGGDDDYFSLSVTSGFTYQIDAEGVDTSMGTLTDPYVVLRDASDVGLASDDDGGVSFNARLVWTASSTGTVYVVIHAADNEDTGTYTLTVSANTPATGAPTISGTAQVGETLTAATSGIMDNDGLGAPGYTHQWVRVDGSTEADISGAMSSTYTLVAADEGKTIKVKVSFTDDANNAETLTSAATAAVAAAGPGAVNLSATDVPVDEGEQATWTVALATQPTGTVTVRPTSDDTGAVTVRPSRLYFTTSNWDTPQTVTVSHPASGGGYAAVTAGDVTVTVTDDETPTAPGAVAVADLRFTTSAERSLSFEWDPPANDGRAPITNYRYSRGVGWIETGSADIRSGSFTGLTNGNSYTVRVQAGNAVGWGASTSVVRTASTETPDPISGPTSDYTWDADVQRGRLDLIWMPPVNPGWGELTYRVEMASAPAAEGLGGNLDWQVRAAAHPGGHADPARCPIVWRLEGQPCVIYSLANAAVNTDYAFRVRPENTRNGPWQYAFVSLEDRGPHIVNDNPLGADYRIETNTSGDRIYLTYSHPIRTVDTDGYRVHRNGVQHYDTHAEYANAVGFFVDSDGNGDFDWSSNLASYGEAPERVTRSGRTVTLWLDPPIDPMDEPVVTAVRGAVVGSNGLPSPALNPPGDVKNKVRVATPPAPVMKWLYANPPQGQGQLIHVQWSLPTWGSFPDSWAEGEGWEDHYGSPDGYEVEWSADRGTTWQAVDPPHEGVEKIYAHGGLTVEDDSTFHYRVRGVNGSGVGPWSNVLGPWPPPTQEQQAGEEWTEDLSPGLQPRDLEADPTTAGNVLSWRAPWRSPEDVTGYQILRRRVDTGEQPWPIVEDTGNTGTTWRDTGVEQGVLYFYRVKTVRGRELSRASNFVEVYAVAVAALPGAPGYPVAESRGAARIDLTWTAPAGDPPPLGYQVQWSADGESGWQAVDPPHAGTETAYADTGLYGGTTRHYRVRAITDDGEGPWSAVAVATTEVPLTASFSADFSAHGGAGTTFVVRLTFSEAVAAGYRTLRDTAVQADQGEVRSVSRVNGSSAEWDITVAPSSDQKVLVTLSPGEGACGESGVICTADGRKLSNYAVWVVLAPPAANTPATGVPAIGGTAQVNETLSADTSGIADANGLDNVSFSYQWLADGAAISGATDSTYTPVVDDVGKTISVTVSFSDDAGNDEESTSAATDAVEPGTEEAKAANSPATGAPAVTGTAQVGETLTVDTAGIADADGLDKASFSYQWQADGADLPGATGGAYTLAGSDKGKAISVKVSFTDDVGNDESLTSAATDAVAAAADPHAPQEAQAANTPATGAPSITGAARVGETLAANTSGIADEDGLENAVFAYQWLAGGADISGATDSTYVPVVDDAGRAIGVRVSFTDDAGFEETLSGAAVAVPADDYTVNEIWETGNWGRVTVGGSATGVIEKPGDRDFFGVNLIRGRTYRIDVAGHGDVGALEQVRLYGVFVYAEDLECSGAYDDPGVTTYVLTAGHSAPHSVAVRAEGDGTGVYRVSVSESDDTGTGCDTTPAAAAQAANTPATGAPAISGAVRVGETLTAYTSVIADEDGLDNVAFSYQWQADDSNISGATGETYTLAGADKGKAISVKVSFTDDAGNEETLTSAATAAVEAKPNTPATGAPAIGRTAQVGETLTADTSGITDEDGLDNASFSYQWQADGADIPGATDSTYTVAGADEGKAIVVKVSFTDDRGHGEELSSAATAAVEAAPLPPLTVSVENVAASHDGASVFTFELRFSEEFGISYKTLRDHAFTVTGGTVKKAQRLEQGSNIGWRITVRPDGNGDVTIVLPETTACEAQGAICTEDGRMLSHRLELTVSGP